MKEEIEALFDKHFPYDPGNPHINGEEQWEYFRAHTVLMMAMLLNRMEVEISKNPGEDCEVHGYLKQVYYALEER